MPFIVQPSSIPVFSFVRFALGLLWLLLISTSPLLAYYLQHLVQSCEEIVIRVEILRCGIVISACWSLGDPD